MKLDASINGCVRLIGRLIRFRRGLLSGGKAPGRRSLPPAAALRALCHGDVSQEQQSFDVLDEVRQSNLHRCPGDADGADEQIHPGLLLGKDMLDL
jgi:hypothetical protein